MRARRILRGLVVAAAALFVLQIVFALTGPPDCLTDWLKGKQFAPNETPRVIVVLGGSGIPSESGLIRTYHAAEIGRGLTGTTFVVSLPTEENPDTSSVGRMRDELVLRGVPAAAILMETTGLNTHEQAVNVRQLLGDTVLHEPVVVVTSGYHMRRAVLCFREAGFTNVTGSLAESVGAEYDPGAWAWLRYGIWGNMAREAEIARELTALLAYKVRGWI